MRKREIEKLLYAAVAEALGVEPKPARHSLEKAATPARKRQHPSRQDQRAAA